MHVPLQILVRYLRSFFPRFDTSGERCGSREREKGWCWLDRKKSKEAVSPVPSFTLPLHSMGKKDPSSSSSYVSIACEAGKQEWNHGWMAISSLRPSFPPTTYRRHLPGPYFFLSLVRVNFPSVEKEVKERERGDGGGGERSEEGGRGDSITSEGKEEGERRRVLSPGEGRVWDSLTLVPSL